MLASTSGSDHRKKSSRPNAISDPPPRRNTSVVIQTHAMPPPNFLPTPSKGAAFTHVFTLNVCIEVDKWIQELWQVRWSATTNYRQTKQWFPRIDHNITESLTQMAKTKLSQHTFHPTRFPRVDELDGWNFTQSLDEAGQPDALGTLDTQSGGESNRVCWTSHCHSDIRTFRHGMLKGKAKVVYQDGSQLVTIFKDSIPHGLFIQRDGSYASLTFQPIL
eukprot:maker-scaffold735_size104922-snap-gene-0.24 protein:Tk08159 transcript:maker-scaffold735_size104922-snap-gene-0.24-mRNA-1 annotation:"peptidase c13"